MPHGRPVCRICHVLHNQNRPLRALPTLKHSSAHRSRLLSPCFRLQSQTLHTKAEGAPLSSASQDRFRPLAGEGLPAFEDGPTYPTVVQQARDNMKKYSSCVLLTRVGSFYELYFEQAEKYGPLLNLKVAQKRTAAGQVPMAGFPFFQLDRFLKILVQDMHEYVAISEEFPNDASKQIKSGGLQFDRKVTRTVTPGTLIDEKFLDQYENNYLLAVWPADEEPNSASEMTPDHTPSEFKAGTVPLRLLNTPVGLAWLDLSTGGFYTQLSSMQSLLSAIARIGAREVVLASRTGHKVHDALLALLEQQRPFISQLHEPLSYSSIDSWQSMMESELPTAEKGTFDGHEIKAGSLLLSYVRERLEGSGVRLQPPVRKQQSEHMTIDKHSMRALEILGTSKDGVAGGKGSLLHTVRRTTTKGGARLLREWLSSPSMSTRIIEGRLDISSMMLEDAIFNEDIKGFLGRTFDSQRLLQKFSLGRGDADDLVSLLKTIEATNLLANVLNEKLSALRSSPAAGFDQTPKFLSLQDVYSKLTLDGPNSLAALIRDSIDEEGLMETHRIEDDVVQESVDLADDAADIERATEGQTPAPQAKKRKSKQKEPPSPNIDQQEPWVLRRTASDTLNRLHESLDALLQNKAALATHLRDELNASSLTLRWTPGLGYICHVKGNRDVTSSMKGTAPGRDVKTTKSTRSFHHPEWNSLGGKIDQAKLRIRGEEQKVIQSLRAQVIAQLVQLRRNAGVLDELDVGCSFAAIAEEQGWVRPAVNDGLDHKILGGRHPTVKQGLEEQGRTFVANDCQIGQKERIWLITGPNMAGKSTFLRQNALISILCQAGSFVPAESAEIGLVDQIFTRVGSADNLFRDQSTFMVEMIETAAILNQATPQSFVIMDEIGRGTTPEDGIAVGFACLHHLYYVNRCRTLFATHFHSLADMTRSLEHLGCYCTDVDEGSRNSFSFVHRLRPGVNRSSHALKVAALAGVPDSAIETARSVLEDLQNKRQPEISETRRLQAAAA